MAENTDDALNDIIGRIEDVRTSLEEEQAVANDDGSLGTAVEDLKDIEADLEDLIEP
jgi:hypothetical protein